MKKTITALFVLLATIYGAFGQESHRRLRVALYPYVPEKAELFLTVIQEYRRVHPEVDLDIVDLTDTYYDQGLPQALNGGLVVDPVDVAEVDTVFLRDLVDNHLISELPADRLDDSGPYLPIASAASRLDGRVFGVPHWACGDFLLFRRDDPDAPKLKQAKTLKQVEEIFGHPADEKQALMTDLMGKSGLGEMYLHRLLDEYQTVDEALKHLQPTDQPSVKAVRRLFDLCPGNFDHYIRFHTFGQFYAKEFSHRKTRAIISYSEGLHDVLDEYLHGAAVKEPAVGHIYDYDATQGVYVPASANDIDAIGAPLGDSGEKMLGWVDALCVRKGLDAQATSDALEFIRFYTSEEFNRKLLVPAPGDAPRYLLPARESLYNDAAVTACAPLYPTFLEIMKAAVSVTAPNLNANLRAIGKSINKDLPSPE
ncbi:MAG TPA: extracellular solute-binding protein [Chthoniobacter sp.]|jgi:thiamine pyridinylase